MLKLNHFAHLRFVILYLNYAIVFIKLRYILSSRKLKLDVFDTALKFYRLLKCISLRWMLADINNVVKNTKMSFFNLQFALLHSTAKLFSGSKVVMC